MLRKSFIRSVLTVLLASYGGYLIGRGSERRTEDVRDWAEAAYETGLRDCGVSQAVSESNKKFAADAVVHAHQGTWHW